MSHTILLLQPNADASSRTYCEYESVNECIEGLCKIYEEVLRQSNLNQRTITYDVSQLFDFIDEFPDLSCLVYQSSTNTYAPKNKKWVKDKVYQLLAQAAGMSSTPDSLRRERSLAMESELPDGNSSGGQRRTL